MFNWLYFLYFLLTLAIASGLTVIWRQLAYRFKILDLPDNQRKIHRQAIPLGGGWAIFLAFFSGLALVAPRLITGDLNYYHWLGFFVGALILMIGGTLDDRFKLSPWQQIAFPLLAIFAVLLGGVEIARLSNPSGGIISLENINWLSSFIIIVWLLGMMYTTKLLDGVDGLVTGLGAVGAFIIFLFTSLTTYYQPDIALAALIFSAACLGFLFFNFSPASVFLGEGGSLLIGFILGVLAIISGAKIAITLLIIGLPALDVAWTIIRRLKMGKNPFRFADRQHLHHRLLDLGLSQRQTALFYYALAIFFGGSGLFLQSQGKILALLVLFLLMLGIVIYFSHYKNKRPRLLFHICCAPCATYFSKEKLSKEFKLTWYFYNPNLVSQEEYDRRLQAVKAAAREYNFNLIIEPYNPAPWQKLIQGHEADPERGQRCRLCYRDRLEKTAQLAKAKGFSYFGSSLLVSPYKDSQALKDIGQELASSYQLKFLDIDFQANDGFRRSYSLAKEKDWYLQKFCGCFFSQKNQQ